jgi:predicted metal-dependent peptidase
MGCSVSKVITPNDGRGILHLGLTRLAHDHPYHAEVLNRWALVADRSVETVGVGVRDHRLVLFYNPEFIADLAVNELAAVLQHAVNHVILGHIDADPADFPDRQARVMAEEVTANEFVAGSLPGHPILLADYPSLQPLESTRERYDRLAGMGGAGTKIRAGGAQKAPDLGQNPASGAPISCRDCTKKALEGTESRPPKPLDDHSRWPGSEAPLSTGAVIRATLANAWKALRSTDREHIAQALRRSVEGRCFGDGAGPDVEEVPEGGPAQLDWRWMLRAFAQRLGEPGPVLNWPSRRAPSLVGVVPGRRRRARRARVLAAIDTSGSVGPELLALIADELAELGRRHEVVVVECDEAVQAVYPFQGRLGAVHGRGGTDFRPVLDPVFLRKHCPKVIVYFTDGCGPAPPSPPPVPLLWCLTPDGQRPTGYGEVVSLANR